MTKRSERMILGLAAAFCMAGCATLPKLRDGSYTASAMGHNGEVKVETTVIGGKIAKVLVLEQRETSGIGDVAIERIPKAIVAKNSAEVDSVSGATDSSAAVMEAVKAALKEASGR
jgi:fumarate reductase flavoprotein subunit